METKINKDIEWVQYFIGNPSVVKLQLFINGVYKGYRICCAWQVPSNKVDLLKEFNAYE